MFSMMTASLHGMKMNTIKDMISELAGIAKALGQESSDPKRPPGRRSPLAPPERVSVDPIFDASGWDITDPALWEEAIESTRRAIEGHGSAPSVGTEALAWYVSFHDNQDAWGIYIPLSSLALMDELCLKRLPMARHHRIRLAWSILLHHEQMHFAVDYACAWFELMLRAPIRREFTARFRATSPFKGIDKAESYLEIEETAANAHMLRQLARSKSVRTVKTVERFVATQPAGYCDAVNATDDTAFRKVIANTLQSYLALWAMEHSLDLGSAALDLSRLLPLEDDTALAECPVHILDDLQDIGVAAGSIRLIHRIPEIVETTYFLKRFHRQHSSVQNDWTRKKEEIKIHLPRPPRFEKLKDWTPPTWSLRLRDGHRAHLQAPRLGETAWQAVDIGNHKEMGHG
jgi:hypothetical protein